jgi:hypothetical protein
MSTQLSLKILEKAPLPQPERRKVIQMIACCTSISAGSIIYEASNDDLMNNNKKIESNTAYDIHDKQKHKQKQPQKQKQKQKQKHKDVRYIRTTRRRVERRDEFLSQLLQETDTL